MSRPVPECYFCHIVTPAVALAPAADNTGRRPTPQEIEWRPVCESHLAGWYDEPGDEQRLPAAIRIYAPASDALRLLARAKYADPSDNDIEVDDDAGTTGSDHGYWVRAWVHVHEDDLIE